MTIYNDQLSQYIYYLFTHEDPTQQRVRKDSTKFGLPAISIEPEEGKFLQFLIRALGVGRAFRNWGFGRTQWNLDCSQSGA